MQLDLTILHCIFILVALESFQVNVLIKSCLRSFKMKYDHDMQDRKQNMKELTIEEIEAVSGGKNTAKGSDKRDKGKELFMCTGDPFWSIR